MKPKDDPTIARIRAARHRISQQSDHDPQKLVAHYIALQEEYQRHLEDSAMHIVADTLGYPMQHLTSSDIASS